MGCSDSKLRHAKRGGGGNRAVEPDAFANVGPVPTTTTSEERPSSSSSGYASTRRSTTGQRLVRKKEKAREAPSNNNRAPVDDAANGHQGLEIAPETRDDETPTTGEQEEEEEYHEPKRQKQQDASEGGLHELTTAKQTVPPSSKASSSSPNVANMKRVANSSVYDKGAPYSQWRSVSAGKMAKSDKKNEVPKTSQSLSSARGDEDSDNNSGSELTISVPANDRRASWGHSSQGNRGGNDAQLLNSFETMSEEHMKQKKLREFTRQCSRLTQYVFVSAEEVSRDHKVLRENNIGVVVNTCRDVCKNTFESSNVTTVWDGLSAEERSDEPAGAEDTSTSQTDPKSIVYVSFSVRDTMQEEVAPFFFSVIEVIEAAAKAGTNVLIHCHQGVSRSGTLVLAYLMWARGYGWKMALETARVKREVLSPNTGFLCQLMEWEAWMHLRWPSMVPSSLSHARNESGNAELYDDVVVAQQASSNKYALSPAHLWEKKESAVANEDEATSPASVYRFEQLPCIAPTPSLFAVTPIRRPIFVSVPDYHGSANSGHAVLADLHSILEGTDTTKKPSAHTRFEIGYVLQQCRSDKDRHRILPDRQSLTSTGVYVVVLPYSLIESSEAHQLASITSSDQEAEDEENEPLESHPVIWIGKDVQRNCRESMIACARAEVKRWRTYMRSRSVDADDPSMSRQYSSVDEEPVEIDEGSNLHEELVTLMEKVKELTEQPSDEDDDVVHEVVGIDESGATESSAGVDTEATSTSYNDSGPQEAPAPLKLGNIAAAQEVQQHALNAEQSNRLPSSPLSRKEPETEGGDGAIASSLEKPTIGVFSIDGDAEENIKCASGESSGNIGKAEFLEDYDREDFEDESCRILYNSEKISESPPMVELWLWFGLDKSQLQLPPESLPQPIVCKSTGEIPKTHLSAGQQVTARLVEAVLPDIIRFYRGSLVECQAHVSVEWQGEESEAFDNMHDEGL